MENSFIVRLSTSVWTARKMDKTATKEARESAGASAKAGVRVYKSVIAADALDKVMSIAKAARAEHCKRTVPWTYEGVGAITTEGYAPYKAAMAKFQAEFNLTTDYFLSVYEVERIKARDYLGSMFNDTDYPTVAALREKFAFAIHAEPLPQAQHFAPVGLPPEVVAEVRRDIVQNNTTALHNANATAWERVTEKVTMLKTRLEEYTSGKVTKFFDSWVDNVKEIVTMIPSINVANDPDLKVVGRRLLVLTAYSSEDLKESVALREEVVKQAKILLDQIGARAQIAA
jgi:hypothetical protein